VSSTRRTELVAVLVLYVVPLTAALVLLLAAGLGQLAVALAVVEAVVVAAVVWAKRTSP
jgi:predicted RNA methylase